MMRVFFLLKRAKLLSHDWFSACLKQLMFLKNYFSASMASHFEIVDEEYIEKLKKAETENTKSIMIFCVVSQSKNFFHSR